MTAKRRAEGPAVKRKPKPPAGAGRGKRRALRVLKWFLIAALAGSLVLIAAFVYLYKTTSIPNPNKDFQTQSSFVYYADGKTPVGQYATQNRQIIPLSEMPKHLQNAVVAAEDRTFWTNHGIDPKGILRAAFNDARGGATQGASTITQQYVKILYLTQERSLSRKVHEAILSLKLQKQLSKQKILEGYLNTIYFGRGAYGVQAAAQAYFGKDAQDLTLRESAVIASVLNNPSAFDPANGKKEKKALRARYRYVLSGMVSMNTIPDETATKAAKHLPKFPVFEQSSRYAGQKGHMLTLVRQELHQLGFTDDQIDGGGLRVTTTFTPKAMAAARAGVMEVRPDISSKFLHVGVATVQPGTGALLGFYGGQDYLHSQINWAEAGGMVGSTFKPASLAAAIADGYSLKSTWEGNSPYTFDDGTTVHNEGDSTGTNYGSAISSVYAMEESVNTAFVDMSASMKNGPQKILTQANKMGIPPNDADKEYPGIPNTSRDLEADSLITLGKARVSAINMANAYATIANGGQRADVHVITKVTDSKGEVKYSYKPHTVQAIKPDVDRDVSYALQQVVLHGTGANAQAIGRPAAGKTGTATNDDDDVSSSWFVGYTPQLATAVMYVRGDGDNALNDWLPPYNGASGYFGAGYPTATWAAVMKRDLVGLPVREFPDPANVSGDPPESGHAPYTPPPTTKAPSSRRTTSAPTSSAPTTSKPTSSAPTSSAPTSTGPPTCIPNINCPSSPTSTSTEKPTGKPTGKPNAHPSARPGAMASRESWW